MREELAATSTSIHRMPLMFSTGIFLPGLIVVHITVISCGNGEPSFIGALPDHLAGVETFPKPKVSLFVPCSKTLYLGRIG
jgi:hypothetical protein